MALNPVAIFNRWFREACAASAPLPESMALATSDRRGRPSVRYVLLKQADESGFVFYTNLDSRKGRELIANPYASLAFYWDVLGKQVRVDGKVTLVDESEADAYWATRPRESQLAGATSCQSRPIASHILLLQRWRQLRQEMSGKAVPRPRGWTGFRLTPQRIEFWIRGEHRLHKRELFTRRRQGWEKQLLQP